MRPFAAGILGGIRAAGAVAPAFAAEQSACETPDISARVQYLDERTSYDLGIQSVITNNVRHREWATYEVTRQVRMTPVYDGECLLALDVVIETLPTIHMTSDYADAKTYHCGRQISLDRERRHAPIARQSYAALPQLIKAKALDLFSDDSDQPHKERVDQSSEDLNGGPLITRFQRDLDAKQAAFHAAERANSANVIRDCRYVTHKGDTRTRRADRKSKLKHTALKCRQVKSNSSGARYSRRSANAQVRTVCSRG